MQASAAQEKTQLDEQRQRQLLERKITSQQDYDNAVKANLGAKAAVEAAKAALEQAKLNLAFATITSPIAGIVGRTDFSVGDFVAAGSAGTPVTTVSTVDPIKIVFALSEKEYLTAAEQIFGCSGCPDRHIEDEDAFEFEHDWMQKKPIS